MDKYPTLEEMLFELKPCHLCSHSCVETQPGVKCPFDKMVEDLIEQQNTKSYERMCLYKEEFNKRWVNEDDSIKPYKDNIRFKFI